MATAWPAWPKPRPRGVKEKIPWHQEIAGEISWFSRRCPLACGGEFLFTIGNLVDVLQKPRGDAGETVDFFQRKTGAEGVTVGLHFAGAAALRGHSRFAR